MVWTFTPPATAGASSRSPADCWPATKPGRSPPDRSPVGRGGRFSRTAGSCRPANPQAHQPDRIRLGPGGPAAQRQRLDQSHTRPRRSGRCRPGSSRSAGAADETLCSMGPSPGAGSGRCTVDRGELGKTAPAAPQHQQQPRAGQHQQHDADQHQQPAAHQDGQPFGRARIWAPGLCDGCRPHVWHRACFRSTAYNGRMPTMRYVEAHLRAGGNTPLVRLGAVAEGIAATCWPRSSTSTPVAASEGPDRAAHDEGAEAFGELRRAARSSSRPRGNTGVGWPWSPSAGVTVRVRLPGQGQRGQRKVCGPYGAEVVVCPTAVPPEHPSPIQRLSTGWSRDRRRVKPNQYANRGGTLGRTTWARSELWEQTTAGSPTSWR